MQTYKVIFCFSDIWIINSKLCLVDVKRSLIILFNLSSITKKNIDYTRLHQIFRLMNKAATTIYPTTILSMFA